MNINEVLTDYWNNEINKLYSLLKIKQKLLILIRKLENERFKNNKVVNLSEYIRINGKA